MSTTTTPRPSLDRLKKQAKKLKKAAGITHCQALQAIAKNHGHSSWRGLLTEYEKAAAN